MDRPVVVVGAGGHAAVVVDALRLCGATILGVHDPSEENARRLGLPWLGGDEGLGARPPSEVRLVNGLGSIGPGGRRRERFEALRERGYAFADVVHPGALVAASVLLGEGAQVMAGAVVQARAELGVNVLVNTRASVDHDCRIGDHVHVAPGVTLSGGVTVGEGAHLGTGCVVVQGIRIGAGATVAAGAVVVREVPAGAQVFGVPAAPRRG